MIRIGTSGWRYKEWGKKFYPEGIREDEYLPFYTSQFDTVELNASFYRLPKKSVFEKWRAETPDGFMFAVKMSQYITHRLRLADSTQSLGYFFENVTGLGEKLGPILVQLPPNLKFETEKFRSFMHDLKLVAQGRRFRIALEPRHRSWFESANSKEVAGILANHNAALVFAHSSKFPYPEDEPITAGFVYLRFHGPKEFAGSLYGEKLEEWVPKIKSWVSQGLDIFIYFNNDQQAYAIRDVLLLKSLVQ